MQFEEARESYIKIATLYYLDGKSQDEIAEIFEFHVLRFREFKKVPFPEGH